MSLGLLRGPLFSPLFAAMAAGSVLFIVHGGAPTGLRHTGWVLGTGQQAGEGTTAVDAGTEQLRRAPPAPAATGAGARKDRS
ncbi:hypothetical protein AB0I10_15975 [Streptomyces sp. NPDC050636]|uniref:hypothetical protein n=1 Tax=Streptomyces sp. NPDC050636 TaxID=3154510 RepID=UPI0034304E78